MHMPKKKQYNTVTVESLGDTIDELEVLFRDVYNKKLLTEKIHERWIERVQRSTDLSSSWEGKVNGMKIIVPESNRVYFNELLRIAITHRDGTAEQIELMEHAIKAILDRIEELKKVTKQLSLHESMSKNLQALDGGSVDTALTQNIIDLLTSTKNIKYQAEALMELRMDSTSNTKTRGEISGK